MPNVYIEPRPLERAVDQEIEYYVIELENGVILEEGFSTQKEAIDRAEALGYTPIIGRVRTTTQGHPGTWR